MKRVRFFCTSLLSVYPATARLKATIGCYQSVCGQVARSFCFLDLLSGGLSAGYRRNGGLSMLVLSRHRDESIMIGDDIIITVVDVRGDKVRLGIDAPTDIPVHRQEVYEAIQREKKASGESGRSQFEVEIPLDPADGDAPTGDPGD